MFRTSYNSTSMQGFDFSMKTSSGDKIALSMYSAQSTQLENTRKDGLDEMRLSLREEYGYSFSYEGNGIDEQDKKEIEAALKKIEPLLKMFQKEPSQISHEEKNNLAFDIKQFLPQPKNSDHENFMKSKTLDKMDEMLKAFDAAEEMRKLAKDVFDMLEEQMKSLTVYA